MSRLDAFDAMNNLFNSSAKAIRDHLASREAMDSVKTAGDKDSTEFPLTNAPDNVKGAHKSMLEAMTGVQQLLMDPVEFWVQRTINIENLSCLRWVVHFKIPAHVPLDRPISYASLAKAAKVPEHQLRQVVPMAITNGIFKQPSPHMLAHTPLSAEIAKNPIFAETILFQTETTAPTALKMAEMTSKYNGSERPNETAHNIAMETELAFFPYLGKNPQIAARLQAGMKHLGGTEQDGTQHLVEMFNWAGLGEVQVVDVGGSTGHASIALAQAFPNLTLTVQDLPIVISKAKSSLLPPNIKDRITFLAHDFFQPQPLSSSQASIFLVRLVLQNHPKTAVQTILRNIASVMRPGALILLNNRILPEPGTVGARDEALGRARSLFMMQAMNGAEREEDEFRELVEGNGAGLVVQEVVKREGSALSLIVVRKV